jgi:hypothetical protein
MLFNYAVERKEGIAEFEFGAGGAIAAIEAALNTCPRRLT